jgi:hypothetical protein
VNDAIPIPGFLAGLQPTVQAARASPAPQLPVQLPSAQQVLSGVSAAVPPALLRDRDLLANAAPLLLQLESVVGEVGGRAARRQRAAASLRPSRDCPRRCSLLDPLPARVSA